MEKNNYYMHDSEKKIRIIIISVSIVLFAACGVKKAPSPILESTKSRFDGYNAVNYSTPSPGPTPLETPAKK